jgi:hypothetical protein
MPHLRKWQKKPSLKHFDPREAIIRQYRAKRKSVTNPKRLAKLHKEQRKKIIHKNKQLKRYPTSKTRKTFVLLEPTTNGEIPYRGKKIIPNYKKIGVIHGRTAGAAAKKALSKSKKSSKTFYLIEEIPQQARSILKKKMRGNYRGPIFHYKVNNSGSHKKSAIKITKRKRIPYYYEVHGNRMIMDGSPRQMMKTHTKKKTHKRAPKKQTGSKSKWHYYNTPASKSVDTSHITQWKIHNGMEEPKQKKKKTHKRAHKKSGSKSKWHYYNTPASKTVDTGHITQWKIQNGMEAPKQKKKKTTRKTHPKKQTGSKWHYYNTPASKTVDTSHITQWKIQNGMEAPKQKKTSTRKTAHKKRAAPKKKTGTKSKWHQYKMPAAFKAVDTSHIKQWKIHN